MTIEDRLAVGCADGDEIHGERQLDPWREPKTPAAKQFVQFIIQMLEDHEALYGLRKRKRKADDLETFQRVASAVISDLAVSALAEECCGLRLYRSNGKLKYGSRYRSPVTTKVLPAILNLLCHPALLLAEQDLGEGAPNARGVQTVIRPTPALSQMLSRHGLSADDFTEVEAGEPVELKGEKEFRDRSAPRVEYEDTEATLRYRQEMRSINRRLAEADLAYIGPNAIDTCQRQLRRVFTRFSFRSGGRLYGGFWQPMKKVDRLCHLRINGEPIVELDYGQIMPRLVYSIANAVPTMNDLYAIPGFEAYRSGIKRVMSSMLFVEKRMTKFPRGTRDLFPANVRVSDVVDAVMATHPAISPFFFKGIGHRCQ
ncbi:hypothetical protein, partial [Tropicimonas sp. IMCC34011]|uniref:hypothetical protein n=1 Tax=Tropicimonas sp. IMCC34011 TaxID=2248759 RepID=UPI000E28A0BA